MKYIFLLLTAIIFFKCSNLPDQNSTTKDDEKIIKDLIQGAFDDLWAGFDSTKVLTYHTPDFIILEHGEVWDNTKIKSWMKGRLANPSDVKRTNRMEYIAIDRYGPSIQASYYNYAEFFQSDTLQSKFRWLESAVAVPTEAGWRLKMMHSTKAPQKD